MTLVLFDEVLTYSGQIYAFGCAYAVSAMFLFSGVPPIYALPKQKDHRFAAAEERHQPKAFGWLGKDLASPPSFPAFLLIVFFVALAAYFGWPVLKLLSGITAIGAGIGLRYYLKKMQQSSMIEFDIGSIGIGVMAAFF
ncbi:hypothetical protein K3555_12555 [Leisingera sp. M527]|uniref:hypothetical protein n=1 Tax=Leisingera sp. M527 TaxID=2867014 RepID=UPI0021A9446B|nr:hypothetical protein [Leisingera sp. M527]UWQ31433.1 hypothetical protein K3555_12555 [Leisingera sp. M527]